MNPTYVKKYLGKIIAQWCKAIVLNFIDHVCWAVLALDSLGLLTDFGFCSKLAFSNKKDSQTRAYSGIEKKISQYFLLESLK